MTYHDTVTIVTPGVTTDYARNVTDWTTATSVDESAWVGGTSTAERLADGDKVVTGLAVHLLPATVATATCRVVWRGDTYQIDGALLPHSRRGVIHHYEAALKRVEG